MGVIGINGTGKSTFLKVLSGVTEPDGGTISRNPNVQVSLLPPEPGNGGIRHGAGAGLPPLPRRVQG